MKKNLLVFIFLYTITVFGQVTTLGSNPNSLFVTQNQATVQVVGPPCCPPPPPPNVLKFTYDSSGNQILRSYIYIVSGIGRFANIPIARI
jgi:hypothetical protein